MKFEIWGEKSAKQLVNFGIGFIVLMLFAWFVLSSIDGMKSSGSSTSSSSTSKTTEKEREYKGEAWTCAQLEMKDKLKSPSTASFEFGGAYYSTEKLYGNTYEVDSYVDAQNSFGATIRTYFTCKVTYNPDKDSCSTVCTVK